MEVSGLEDEFELSGEIPRLLYVKTPAPDRDPRLAELLSRMKRETAYRRFRTAAELGRLVRDDLATLLSERFAATPSAAVAVGPMTPDRRRQLPAPTTPLVGREQAIDDIADLVLRRDVRLVTPRPLISAWLSSRHPASPCASLPSPSWRSPRARSSERPSSRERTDSDGGPGFACGARHVLRPSDSPDPRGPGRRPLRRGVRRRRRAQPAGCGDDGSAPPR
jgi:hypothetical protein